MRGLTRARWVAGAALVALAVTACGGGDDPESPAPGTSESESEGPQGGTLDVHRGSPSRLTVPVNEAGLPSLAFPVGRSTEGLPIGAQLIGAPYDEETLLAVVEAFQSTRSLPIEHPALDYRVPGDRHPDRLPWEGAVEPG